MNDFTKEELIWLEQEIRLAIDEYQQPEIAYQIHDKVQSMIDNYCAHENRKQCNISEQIMCLDCGEELHE